MRSADEETPGRDPRGAAPWLAGVFALAVLVGDGPAASTPPGATVEIEIRGMGFRAPDVRVSAGTTVRWVNRDPVPHTVTSDDGTWGSHLLRQGDTFQLTFEEPGAHAYHCDPHPFMEGRIRVERRPRPRRTGRSGRAKR